MRVIERLRDAGIDIPVFAGSVVIIVGLCLPLMLYPDVSGDVLGAAFDWLTHSLGVFYIAGAVITFCLLLYLALSDYGDIRLGADEPEFSTVSWAGMLYCGGIGTSVLFWGTVEWAYYMQAPPFGVAPETDEARLWAMSYPMFHWGLLGWAFYCLPGVAVAYNYYVRGTNSLRLSSACELVLGSLAHGPVGRFIDLLFVIGLVGASSIGIGLAVPLIATLVASIFGLDREAWGFGLDVLVIIGVTILFASSVWMGLEKGIRRLSDLNVRLAWLLLITILIVGPTLFILEGAVEAIGHMFQNFVRMSTWTDPNGTSNFVESWTVFYWAWWLALGPYMGVFITKISKGRTLRQMILGCIGYGSFGCMCFFMIMGNYALYLETSGQLSVLQVLNEQGAPNLIVGILSSLPFKEIILVLFAAVCVIFAATSYDSSSYTLAASSTRSLKPTDHPARWLRVFWAFLLGLLPISLIYVGGLKPLQSAVTLASVPLFFVAIIMTISLLKGLRSPNHGRNLRQNAVSDGVSSKVSGENLAVAGAPKAEHS